MEERRLQIFDDVIEEYVDTRLLLNRFNQFRDQYLKWYKVCFIEECAGSVIMPILKGTQKTSKFGYTFCVKFDIKNLNMTNVCVSE